MQVDDVLKLYVSNNAALWCPFRTRHTGLGNQSPPVRALQRLPGHAHCRQGLHPGIASGDAMMEMERLASQLPPGFTVEWTGQSLQEKQSASQAPILLALSMLVVLLVLAGALRELVNSVLGDACRAAWNNRFRSRGPSARARK
ncbi:efflux RND transporter permease subunit [Bradyrhizobium zhanjiangense]|uniref:efflux RND transporter permease subunit n=1 Tax=Bradyrhizobium zhanjiangense TaxID=1325107 RepID=UPI003B838A6E